MGKAKSRHGGSTAPAQEASPPPRKRRRGRKARANFPAKPPHARAFAGDVATGSPSADATEQNIPPRGAGLGLRSVQVELPKTWTPAEPVPTQAGTGTSGKNLYVGASDASPSRTLSPGPSLRQDIPRPPLRTLLLRTWRRGKLTWLRGLARMRADAMRTAAYVVARLDAYVWQPALWPFRPAQREMLARTLAVLSVAIVALAWVAAYSTLAPTHAARPPAPSPAPPKQLTERVVSPALPAVEVAKAEVPKADVPLPVPAPNRRRR